MATVVNSATAAGPKRVLIVNSFGTAAPPFTIHSTSFEHELVAKTEEGIALDEVALDLSRNDDREMQQAMVDYLEKRQANWKPDLVVPIGSPAAVFVINNRDRLFPKTPILIVAGNRQFLPPGEWEKDTVFVGHAIDIPGFFEDILQVAPRTKNIEVVMGATALERTWREAFQKAAGPLANRINFTYYNDLSFDQMLERAAKLPPNSYIFFLVLLRDAEGVTLKSDEALQRLHRVANAPMNGLFLHQMGMGIVGGRLLDGELLGKEAARVALRMLRGEPASNIPSVILKHAPPRYDWRELRRWRLDEKLLPPGSTVVFREPTLWNRYWAWILAGFSIFILQLVLITGLLLNLFRRRRAEISLGESEKRFQTMADASPVLMWVSGEDKLCTYVNKAWLNFTGRRIEEELGHGWAESIHPDDRENAVRTYVTAFDAREPFVMHYRLKRHDGQYRSLTDQGVLRSGPRGNFRGYVGACLDITDLLQQERALNEFEERVTLAAEAAQLGVWELNTRTSKVWVSDKCRELFQFRLRLVPCDEFQDRVHPEDRALVDSAMTEAIATHGGYEIEYRTLQPDGSVRWMTGRARCVADQDGALTRLLGVSMDVTARKQVEEEARRQRTQINALTRVSLLGEMTASLAHELNQPLSAIISNANAGMRFMDKGKAEAETIHEILEDVAADARRANEIILNVRNTIKKGEPVRRPISMNEIVESVAHMIGPDATSHCCEVETSLADNLPPIEGDPIQIQEVLINLIGNAFDAMHETRPDERRVEIATKENGHQSVHVSVRDHGVGISDEVRERLFEQFYTTKEEGLGMGLAIVRSIVETHGGVITAENAEGGGARFDFTLPLAKDGLK